MSIRFRFAALAMMVVLAVVGMTAGVASAQDATPTATECVSPGVAMEDMASPEAMEDMASPEAMEEMTAPEATPLPEGQPADEGTSAAITATLENYVACFNAGAESGDPGLYVGLESENYIASQGFSSPQERVESEMGSDFTAELLSVSNPLTYDDGRVSADIAIVLNGHWYQELRSFLVQSGDIWLYDAESTLKPNPQDAATISVNGISITEVTDEATGQITYAFEFLGSTTIIQTEALIFNITNNGEELHEAVVVRLPEGADPMGLLDESVSFEDVEFFGGVFDIMPGETQDLALLNMEPGVYTMLCFYPGPSGMPHAAEGMIGQFEIVAAEE